MKKLVYVLTLFCALIFTSCFDVIEEITIAKDGSGTAKTTVDMSQVMGMLGMFMPDSLQESMNLDNIFEGEIPRYRNMSGIANVKASEDKEYVYSLIFDFEDMEALNKAMAAGSSETEGDMLGVITNYGFKKRKFSRISNMTEGGGIMDEIGMSEEEMEQAFEFMSKPTYKVIYKLPRKVKKIAVTDKTAKVSQEEQKVSIEYDLMEFTKQTGEVMNHMVKF